MANQDWFDCVHEVHAGLLAVYLIDAKSAARLLRDTMGGDAKAARLFDAFVQTGRRIVDAPRRAPVLCAGCPRCIRRVERDIVFGIAVPSATIASEPSTALGFAICHRCSSDPETLMAKAEAGLRLIWPDLRPIVVTHRYGGNA